MLNKVKKTNGKGFTIIEVMIVLAIAGLILLIVLLAVPALQRNARNTSRKSDATAVLAGVSEYNSNNAGALPSNAKYTSPNLVLCNAAGCSGTDAQANVKLGYYGGFAAAPTKGDVTMYTTYTAPPATPADELIIEEQATCTSATAAAAGGSRATAVLYGIEASGTASGYQWQCTGS